MTKEKGIILSLIFLFIITIGLSVSQKNPFTKKTSDRSFLPQKQGIGLIQINGPITASMDAPFANVLKIDSIVQLLLEYKKDNQIKAIVIRINSPGGTAGASQELYNEILKFKKETNIPVVASIADVGASGAYWVALACDSIFANPSSMIGSIGVIMNNMDLAKFSQKYGIGKKTIKSAEFKDAFSSWRETTDAEKEYLQALVKNIHAQFTTVVSKRRPFDLKTAKTLSDGRIYTGEQALTLQLIDQLGGLQDAIKYAAKKANIKGEPTIITKPTNPFDQLMHYWKKQTSAPFFNLFSNSWTTQ